MKSRANKSNLSAVFGLNVVDILINYISHGRVGFIFLLTEIMSDAVDSMFACRVLCRQSTIPAYLRLKDPYRSYLTCWKLERV